MNRPSVGFCNQNLGNYESERLEMTIELADDDNPKAACESLIAKVKEQLKIDDGSSESPF